MFSKFGALLCLTLICSDVIAIPIDNDLLPIKEQKQPASSEVCQVASSDFLFIVDGSTSIGADNFELVKRFLVTLIDDIPAQGRRVALVQFSGTPRTEFGFDTYAEADNSVVEKAILATPYKTGTTKIGLATDHAIKEVLQEAKGDRPDVPNTIITITDGRSQDNPGPAADRLRATGALTLGLGITDSVDDEQLLQVAGDPKKVFKAADFDRLDDELRRKIAGQRTCVQVTAAPVSGSGLEVVCKPGEMMVTGRTKNPFNGHVFSKGSFRNESCRVQGDGSNEVTITIPNDGCGTTRRRSADPPGFFIENTVHFKFHPQFTTKADRSIKIGCFYMETEKRVETAIGVSMVTPTNYTQLYPMPACRYTVHQDSPDGPEVRFSVVGQSIYHKWTCNDTSGEEIFGMRVYDCYVTSLDGEQVPLLDNAGCSIDKFIMGNLEYAPVGMRATVETHVFKFADSANLQFQCQIAICVKFDGGCQDTPPTCPEAPGNVTRIPSSRRRVLKREVVPEDSNNMYIDVATDYLNVIGVDAVDYVQGNADEVLSEVEHMTHDLNAQLDRHQHHTAGAPQPSSFPAPASVSCVHAPYFYSLVILTIVLFIMLTSSLLTLVVKHQRSSSRQQKEAS